MRVCVQIQRFQGIKLTTLELKSQPWVNGDLATLLLGPGSTLCATLMGSGAVIPAEVLPTLRDVRLIQLGGDLILLRGIESLPSGAGVVQQWRCTLCD
jgi:hypothetical protein